MKRIKLVLSGSGALYPVHAGAVIKLAEAGYEIEEVCGTSGGAIIAAALASGIKPNNELVKMIKASLPAKNNLLDKSISSLIFNWGLIKGNKIRDIFSKYFVKKFNQTRIPLHVITTNIDREDISIFSTKDTPTANIAEAVRASISIPGVFAPIKINGHLHVDGGLMANYFLDIFGAGENVIGLRFKSLSDQANTKKIKDVKDYVSRVINTMITANMREHIEDAIFARTIILESNHGGLDFNMTDGDVDDMIHEGYRAAEKWLSE